jgi:hypothetical protein
MKQDYVEISINGAQRAVPCVLVAGKTVVAKGKYIKIASVHDEEFLDSDAVENPDQFIKELKKSGLRADILSFAQTGTAPRPALPYYKEFDNAAVIPITTSSEWWEKRLPQETRRNVRRATKSGIIVRPIPFTDELVSGIVAIYNETPVRQGRSFWHYGKDFESVKRENATYLEQSEFFGAYLQDELVGFAKVVYVGQTANIMQILCKNAHTDKRPSNALIAKAVEVAAERRLSHLTYCKYVYGKNDTSTLTEFKRRNGFEQLLYPRYYVALTLKGQIALWLRLHNGVSGLIPPSIWRFLVKVRGRFFDIAGYKKSKPAPAVASRS